jgi:AraC-like DNA-binding protein
MAMMPARRSEPLSRHVLFRTADPAQAEFEGARAMSAHRLRLRRPRNFGARFHAATVGSSTLVYLNYGGAVALEASAPMDYYTLHVALTGGFDVVTDIGETRVAAGSACVLSPTERLRIRFAIGTAQVAAKLPVEVVDRTFSRVSGEVGRGRLRFDLLADGALHWVGALRLAVHTVDRCDSGLVDPELGIELERMLVTTLLLSQSHSDTPLMFRAGGSRGYRAALVAADIIEVAPERPMDIITLARAAGVSVRTLQEGFRQRFGRSPSVYLRDLRLQRAHDILRKSDSAGEQTVTSVALACGFGHLGRFAVSYRDRYGVSPSVTLSSPRDPDDAASTG